MFVALSLVVEVAESVPGDDWTLETIHDAAGTALDDVMKAIGAATDPLPLLIVAAVVAVGLVVRGRRRDAAILILVLAVAMIGNRILKEVIARPRPGVRPFPEDVSQHSYPSGHAANTMALFAALMVTVRPAHGARWFVLGGVTAVIVVGISRLITSVHFPSDVLAGWLWVGALAALAASWPARGEADDPAAAQA